MITLDETPIKVYKVKNSRTWGWKIYDRFFSRQFPIFQNNHHKDRKGWRIDCSGYCPV